MGAGRRGDLGPAGGAVQLPADPGRDRPRSCRRPSAARWCVSSPGVGDGGVPPVTGVNGIAGPSSSSRSRRAPPERFSSFGCWSSLLIRRSVRHVRRVRPHPKPRVSVRWMSRPIRPSPMTSGQSVRRLREASGHLFAATGSSHRPGPASLAGAACAAEAVFRAAMSNALIHEDCAATMLRPDRSHSPGRGG